MWPTRTRPGCGPGRSRKPAVGPRRFADSSRCQKPSDSGWSWLLTERFRASRVSSMGKIVSNFFISLDGVVESPDQWHFPYFNDEMGQVIGSGMATTGAWLMGRKLYSEWSEYWPPNADDQ